VIPRTERIHHTPGLAHQATDCWACRAYNSASA
jgi:hypothetical protein